MRNLFLVVLIVLILPACNLHSATADVTGTYQRTMEHEAYTLFDTIVIDKGGAADGRYLVINKSTTRYKDKDRKPKNRKKEYTGSYKAEDRILQTPDPGLAFYFDDQLESFRMGSVTFQRVK